MFMKLERINGGKELAGFDIFDYRWRACLFYNRIIILLEEFIRICRELSVSRVYPKAKRNVR